MKLLKIFLPCLAFIAIITSADGHSNRRHRNRCNLRQCDCGDYKVLNTKRCACECPAGYSKDDCYKNEIWDDEYCTCYCPRRAPFPNPNPSNMYWSRSSCKFKCIKKLECKFGSWNSKTCSCPAPPTTLAPNTTVRTTRVRTTPVTCPTTTVTTSSTTKTPVTTESTTQSTTQTTTGSTTTSTTTQSTTTTTPTTTTTETTTTPTTTTTTPTTTTTTPTTTTTETTTTPTTTTTTPTTTTTTPTTTTTVTTTTVSASCSINLVPYNPSVNPTAPINNAVLAGNYFDGSDAYVGVIEYPSNYCNNQRTAPARLKATGTNPGGYAECIVENFAGSSAFYLQNDPNFIWINANITNVVRVPNLVHYTNAYGWDFTYGRVQSTATNGSTYWSVGKIHVDGRSDYKLYAWGQSGRIDANTYQVLACRGSVNPTPVPTTTQAQS